MAIEAWLVMTSDKPHSVYLDRHQAEYAAKCLVGSGGGVVSIRTMRADEPVEAPLPRVETLKWKRGPDVYLSKAEPEGPAP